MRTGVSQCSGMELDSFPILTVDDLAGVARFYELLGFTRTYAFPAEGIPVFVMLSRGEQTVGISARQDRSDDDRFAYWVYVADVDETFVKLTASGGVVEVEPHDEPWGERLATVRDPAGNKLHLGAPVPDA